MNPIIIPWTKAEDWKPNLSATKEVKQKMIIKVKHNRGVEIMLDDQFSEWKCHFKQIYFFASWERAF